MPYPGVPEHLTGKMERCVEDVMEKQGKDKSAAIAICHDAIVGKDKSAFLDFYLVMKRNWTAQMRQDLKDGKMRGEFAGPDESFPIAGPEDVHAAYMSAGRAGGDPDKIRQAVIRIAKKYGWESGLPESVKKEKPKSIALSGVITKAQKMSDGRVKWRARVNSGEFDQEGERFDRSYFEEVVKNFAIQQEAVNRGDSFPIEVKLDDGFVLRMDRPIQDIAHYSYFMSPENRNKARTGYPTKLWLDGNALMSEGYYDNTPLGQLAAKAALAERDVEKRRMSLGTYPDWGLVEDLPTGQRVFKGGRGRAYLDHEAITSCPVDTDTEILTLSEVSNMPTQKDDAVNVLGEGSEELIEELEKAKTKSGAEDVVLKAEEEAKVEDKVEDKAKDKKDESETETKAEPEAKVESQAAEAAMKSFLTAFMPKFGEQVMARMDAVIKAQVGDRLDQLEAKIGALGATETEKIKAALESNDWLNSLVDKSLSVQHGNTNTVVKGDAEQVKETHQPDEFAEAWGNPEE